MLQKSVEMAMITSYIRRLLTKENDADEKTRCMRPHNNGKRGRRPTSIHCLKLKMKQININNKNRDLAIDS